MIYLDLFFTFLKIGAFSFGGGYGMLSVIREQCLSHGWLTEEGIANFIAVSESTPGPIAINMATFIGSSQGGILGSFLATLGVVLPAFTIILLIAAIMKKLLQYAGVKAGLTGIQPVVVGLILTTGATMLLSTVTGISTIESKFSFDYKSLVIFAVVAAVGFIYKKMRKKAISPIILILISAILGIVFFGLLQFVPGKV